MPNDLKIGLVKTLYSTWLHNNLVVALVVGIVWVVLLLVFRPKRKFVFFLIGFILLALQFEYQKHFSKALEEQTIASVILQGDHIRVKSLMEDFFQKLIPFGLWFGGWGLIFLGMLG